MKYWLAFVNFIFIILRFITRILTRIYNFIKILWMPIYTQEHPAACEVIDWLNGKKTYIISIGGIIGLIIGYKEHAVTLGSVITTLPILFMAITIRHGMARNAPTAENEIPPCYPPPCPCEYNPNCTCNSH